MPKSMGTHDDEAGSSRSKRSRQYETVEEELLPQVHHEFLLWEGCNRDAKSRNPILRVIHKMITYGLCQRMAGYDKIQKNDLWILSMFDARHQNGYANVAWLIARWMKRKGAGTQKESQICYGQFISKIARKCKVLTEDVLIPEDPQPGLPRVGIPRPPIASMQDLYDKIGRMEIRQECSTAGSLQPPSYAQPQQKERKRGRKAEMERAKDSCNSS
ncbi:hypothetical protein Tco_0132146 [Tanacetum coccineum]